MIGNWHAAWPKVSNIERPKKANDPEPANMIQTITGIKLYHLLFLENQYSNDPNEKIDQESLILGLVDFINRFLDSDL